MSQPGDEALRPHYLTVVGQMRMGEVVPVLGAGANLIDRPAAEGWALGRHLPDGEELAEHLAGVTHYPYADKENLLRVSEYVELNLGEGPLYNRLHEVFEPQYPPTGLHRFLAALPAAIQRPQLIVTTNYDDTLELAFQDAGEPFDVVTYQASGEDRGLFVHRPPDGEAVVIRRPNEYRRLSLSERSVILKVHGAVDRSDRANDSYVVTEDHYIEYLSNTTLNRLVPVTILSKLLQTSFLFLGYGLKDWNLRVILHQLWQERNHGYTSWAVQKNPDPLDLGLWGRKNVRIHSMPLDAYLQGLLDALAE